MDVSPGKTKVKQVNLILLRSLDEGFLREM